MNVKYCGTLALLAAWVPCGALAFDIGEPSFRLEPDDPLFRFEVFSEWFDRDIDLEYAPIRVGTPTDGPQAVVTAGPPIATTEEADQVFLRWVIQPAAIVSAQFDLGFDGESTAGDSVVTLGGAARVLLTQSGPFQLSTQVSAHFVPKFDTYETGNVAGLGAYVEQGEYNAYEYGAALIGSMTADVTENVEIVTYMAPRLSAYRGRFRSYSDLTDTGDRLWIDGVLEQSSPFGFAIGSRVSWGKHFSARVEGRLAGEASLSAGVGAAY